MSGRIAGISGVGIAVLALVVGVSVAVARGVPFVGGDDTSGVSPSTSYQAEAAADGHVSDDEMAAAVQATVNCIRAQGFDARAVAGDPRDRVARTILVVTKSSEEPSAVKSCKREYMSDLDLIYALQEGDNSPLPVSEMGRVFDECLTENGYPQPPGASLDPYSAEPSRQFRMQVVVRRFRSALAWLRTPAAESSGPAQDA